MICKLEDYIRDSGLRKDYIANKLGVSVRMLRKYEKGESLPPLDKAFILADMLGVKVDDLYSRIKD